MTNEDRNSGHFFSNRIQEIYNHMNKYNLT